MSPTMFTSLVFALTTTAAGADPGWPQFRGPGGSGVADGQKPPTDVTVAPAWKVAVPPGASSPCVVGGRVFLTAFENGKLFTLAYDTANGRELWRAEAPAKAIEPFHKSEGSPAASTPASDGERVVVYFGSCGLFCYDLAGKELWRHEMPTVKTNYDFGTGTSPVIADGRVFLVRDTEKQSDVFAFDIASGRPAWRKPREGYPTSFSTPTVWHAVGGKVLVVPGFYRLKAYDLATGAERWTVGNLAAAICTTAVVGDGMLFFAGWSPGNEDAPMPAFDQLLAGADDDKDGALSRAETAKTFLKDFFDSNDINHDGKITRDEWDSLLTALKRGKNAVIAVKPGGSGDVTRTHVAWRRDKGLPYVPSPVLYRGRLYLVKDGGLVSAYEAATGKPVFVQERLGQAGGSYYASPVAADGYLYFTSLNGVLTVIEAGDRVKTVSRVDLGERAPATPAVVGGRLYVRTAGHLMAFGGTPAAAK
jgi:outer membrane protein assembly factor BamB